MNMFLPMTNTFAYSYSVKICPLGFDKLLESTFCLLLVVEAFSLQKICWDARRTGSQLARGQVKMADEEKRCSPVRSTFEALSVRHAARRRLGRELGPFCWPVPWLRFSMHLVDLLSMLLRYSGFARIQKISGSDWQQTTKQWPWPFVWHKFGFGECFGASPLSNHWAGHPRLSYKH